MPRFWLLLSTAFAATFAVTEDTLKAEWEEYKKLYDKSYSSEDEERSRFEIFTAKKKSIDEHNKQYENGDVSYSVGLNQFSDMTHEEFLSSTSCSNGVIEEIEGGEMYVPPADFNLTNLPSTVDWRQSGYVTPVRDQKGCGACYAMASMAALEGQHFRKTRKLVSLSVKNIVDCSRQQGNNGCYWGWPDKSFNYVIQNKGVDTEASYPYIPREDSCKFKRSGVGATMKSITYIKRGSEADLMYAVATRGPVATCIDGRDRFDEYTNGVYYGPKCSTTTTTHCVLIVGYGSLKGKKYWLVKNSWGTGWGLKGYAYMSRDRNNNCAIATGAVVPNV